MYKVTVVLLVLYGVLVSNSLKTKDINEPAATSYTAREDGDGSGKTFGFGFSKKSGYNKMVITTHLSPVPEEVAESYSTYVVHPLNNRRSRFNKIPSHASLQANPIVVEDTEDVPNYLKLFPIVVEDKEEDAEQQELGNENKAVHIDDKLNNEPDKDWYEEWFFKQPNGENFDDEIKEIYQKLFADEPLTTSSVGYYKSSKNQFDTFYEGEFKEFFGDDDDEEDKGAKAEKDKEWFTKFPYDYDFEDKSDSGDKNNNKWNQNYLQEPKYNMRHSYNLHDHDYNFGLWHEW